MSSTVLVSVLIGQLTVTSYRSVPQQTDDSPQYTSIGEHVHPRGVAVSPDLLCPAAKRFAGKKRSGPFTLCQRERGCPNPKALHYGDGLYVDHYGFKVVNDVMNARHRRRIDIWVPTYEAEKQVGTRNLKVWLVKFKGE